MKKNVEIQILRGVAVLLTMIEHIPLISVSAIFPLRKHIGFWVGVDMFFVISGYVITCSLYPLLNAVRVGGNWPVHLKMFWYKRAFRILPAAWLWVFITLLMAALFNHSAVFLSFSTSLRDAAAAIFQYANFHMAGCWMNNGFGKFCSWPSIFGHYWSLSLEEQFYLVFPLLMVVIGWRWRVPSLVLFLLYLSTLGRFILGWGWHTRVDGLIWGSLFALYFQNRSFPRISSRGLVLLVRGASILLFVALLWWAEGGFSWCLSKGGYFFTVWLALVAFISALLVLLAIFQQQFIWFPRWISELLSVIGERSYAVYLAHSPSFALIKCLVLQLSIQETRASVMGMIVFGFGISFPFCRNYLPVG